MNLDYLTRENKFNWTHLINVMMWNIGGFWVAPNKMLLVLAVQHESRREAMPMG